jgi:alkylated DNA repair protein (DNA oxidative demethylase)
MMEVGSGVRYFPGYLDAAGQRALLAAMRAVLVQAPLYQPHMPRSGNPQSVRMTNCGPLGWVSDIDGYRYQPAHPVTGQAWPPMPPIVLQAWEELALYPHPPEACLVNYYAPGTRMGLHQDKDEKEFSAPVVSLSLGDDALFRVGGTRRNDPTRSFRLRSGDAVVLGGEARLAFHGVDRIFTARPRCSTRGGRLNLTLRRVGLRERSIIRRRIGDRVAARRAEVDRRFLDHLVVDEDDPEIEGAGVAAVANHDLPRRARRQGIGSEQVVVPAGHVDRRGVELLRRPARLIVERKDQVRREGWRSRERRGDRGARQDGLKRHPASATISR